MNVCNRHLFAVSVLLLSLGCSSAKPLAERIDPPALSNDQNVEKPNNVIADAMKLEEFHLFSDSVSSNLERLLVSGPGKQPNYRQAQSAVCEGKNPRFAPKYKVHLIIPKSATGIPLDRASKSKQAFIQTARLYLKQFFYEAVGKEMYQPVIGNAVQEATQSKVNADYLQLLHGGNESWRGLSFAVPVSMGRSRQGLETYYKTLRYQVTHVEARDDHIWQHVYSVIYPKERLAVLAPRAIPFLGIGWDKYYGSPFIPTLGLAGNSELFLYQNHPSLHTVNSISQGLEFGQLDRRRNFIVSDYGWKLNALDEQSIGSPTQPVYPLHVAYLSDLQLLVENFGFILPLSVAHKALGIAEDDNQSLQHLGFDFSTLKFSPSSAIENHKWVWQKLLESQTSITEAAQSDGSIHFELSLNLDLFCGYGTPLSELQSQ